MFDDFEEQYQSAIDTLDVKYDDDGHPYISIHTVDLINNSIAEVIGAAMEANEAAGHDIVPEDTFEGAVWVMAIWKQLHDELCLRGEVKQMPDTVPTDLLDED